MRKVQFIFQIYCILVHPQNDAAKIVSVSAMLVYIHQKNKLVHYNWNEPFTQMSRTLRPYVMRMRDI